VFFDRFLIAHAVGYWAKAIVFRDMRIIWFLSVFWEVIEISTEHWMENFKECWYVVLCLWHFIEVSPELI
jgi:phosphatidylserine synthase 2